MDKKEQVLHYYRADSLSLREISRRVGLNAIAGLTKRDLTYPHGQEEQVGKY